MDDEDKDDRGYSEKFIQSDSMMNLFLFPHEFQSKSPVNLIHQFIHLFIFINNMTIS